MKIGIPREIKTNEARVALTPGAVLSLTQAGHDVLVESGAGLGSGFSDEDYTRRGATLIKSADELFESAPLIVKVKEPQAEEFSRIRPGQVIFGYFHLAASEELTRACLDSGMTALAFETLEKGTGLPLLSPMSAIAGRLSIQVGARLLETPQGGSGVLLGGVPGVEPGRVVIIGAGIVGENAAQMAAGLGAKVTLVDVNPIRLHELSLVLPKNVTLRFSDEESLDELIAQADLLVGAVLLPGRRVPHLILRRHLRAMRPGSALVDVCIDQGGAAETSHPTTHQAPVFTAEGVTHYCVANMPGAVPSTSTRALSAVVLPEVLALGRLGVDAYLRQSAGHRKTENLRAGRLTNADVALTFPHLVADLAS